MAWSSALRVRVKPEMASQTLARGGGATAPLRSLSADVKMKQTSWTWCLVLIRSAKAKIGEERQMIQAAAGKTQHDPGHDAMAAQCLASSRRVRTPSSCAKLSGATRQTAKGPLHIHASYVMPSVSVQDPNRSTTERDPLSAIEKESTPNAEYLIWQASFARCTRVCMLMFGVERKLSISHVSAAPGPLPPASSAEDAVFLSRNAQCAQMSSVVRMLCRHVRRPAQCSQSRLLLAMTHLHVRWDGVCDDPWSVSVSTMPIVGIRMVVHSLKAPKHSDGFSRITSAGKWPCPPSHPGRRLTVSQQANLGVQVSNPLGLRVGESPGIHWFVMKPLSPSRSFALCMHLSSHLASR